jgi:hypothetical protein
MRRFSLVAAIALSLAVALTVQSAPQPTGNLHVPVGMSLAIKVPGQAAGQAAVVPTGRDILIPAGKYEPASLTCDAVAPNAKELWTIKVAPPNWGTLKEIVVDAKATTTIEAGPPFSLKTLIYRAENKPTGKVIPFTLRIFGKAGELYDYNTLKKGTVSAPQVGLQIVNEKGTVLATGTLHYG